MSGIRQTGATSQYILLPGTGYTSAKGFVSDGSAAALINVTNLDGSTTNLIFDVHQYLDSDGSGTHANCVTDEVADTFTPLATYLRQNKRMALLSEIGGGSNDPSCLTGTDYLPCYPKFCKYQVIDQFPRRVLGTLLSGPELGRIPRIHRLGSWCLRDILHPQPHAVGLGCRRLG